MADFFTHLAFAKLTSEKLKIKNLNLYYIGALIPDLCKMENDKNKLIGHFALRDENGFKVTNTNIFANKYIKYFNNDLVLGMYNHLYLDKYIYNDLYYKLFDFKNGIMVNKKTNIQFDIKNEFFAKDGIYKEYDAMNKFISKDFNLDVEKIDFNVDLTTVKDIKEYDFDKLINESKKLYEFARKDSEYTGKYIEYNDVKKYIIDLAPKFVCNIQNLLKL